MKTKQITVMIISLLLSSQAFAGKSFKDILPYIGICAGGSALGLLAKDSQTKMAISGASCVSAGGMYYINEVKDKEKKKKEREEMKAQIQMELDKQMEVSLKSFKEHLKKEESMFKMVIRNAVSDAIANIEVTSKHYLKDLLDSKEMEQKEMIIKMVDEKSEIFKAELKKELEALVLEEMKKEKVVLTEMTKEEIALKVAETFKANEASIVEKAGDAAASQITKEELSVPKKPVKVYAPTEEL